MEKKKRFIKAVSIVLIVAFINLTIYTERQKAEAVAPIVAILIDAAICSAISAGVTYAVPKIEQHIAAQQVANLTEAEIAAIELEGGVKKLTSAEIKAAERWGLKPKPGVKSVFKLKGAGKAALISGVLSLGIAGVTYAIDYATSDRVGDGDLPEGITEEIVTGSNTEGVIAPGQTILLFDDVISLGDALNFSRDEGVRLNVVVTTYFFGYNYYPFRITSDNILERGWGGLPSVNDVNSLSLYCEQYWDPNYGYDGSYRNGIFYSTVPTGQVLLGPENLERIRASITNVTDEYKNYSFFNPLEGRSYHYTGEVASENVTIINNNYYDNQRDILEQTLEKQDEILYLLQNEDGTVDIQTTTELSDGTEVVEPGATDEESHGGILGWFREVWLKLCEIANSILEIPLHLFEAIQTLLTDLFVPTIAFTDILNDIKTVAMTKAPFSWFDAFVGSANVTYGDVPLVISWTAGVHTNQDVTVTVPKQENVRDFSTVIITFVALFAAYHEIRRWVG